MGFWLDSFDYVRLRENVLDPLGAGGSRRYRTRANDVVTDELFTEPERLAQPGAVVIIDGLFLHRPELRDAWNFTVFLDVPFDVTARRMAVRDGTSPDPEHPAMRRYMEAQRRYRAECDPLGRASLVIDNTDTRAPTPSCADHRNLGSKRPTKVEVLPILRPSCISVL